MHQPTDGSTFLRAARITRLDDAFREETLSAMAATRPFEPTIDPAWTGEWLAFAVRNDVGPIVAHAVEQHGLGTEEHRAEATRIHDESAQRMAVLMAALDEVAETLQQRDIPLVALKNAGIARGLFPCAACTPMGDLDVLVDRTQFRDAHDAVTALGYRLRTRGSVEAADLDAGEESGGTEYVRTIDGVDVWLELQWRPVAGRWITPDQEPSSSELLERSVTIPGTAVRLLHPDDNLLQVCLHTAKHSYVRAPGLRLHTDVDRITAAAAIDWDEFCATVEALHCRTAVYLSLALAEALLASPVPHGVLSRLRPSRAREAQLLWMIRRADVFEPAESKFSRAEMLLFHAALYDDARGLAASALDVRRDEVRASALAGQLPGGVRRVADLVTRYQR